MIGYMRGRKKDSKDRKERGKEGKIGGIKRNVKKGRKIEGKEY